MLARGSWFDKLTTNGEVGPPKGNVALAWFDRLTTNGGSGLAEGKHGAAWFDKLTTNGKGGLSEFVRPELVEGRGATFVVRQAHHETDGVFSRLA
jgi:hypothetical protein